MTRSWWGWGTLEEAASEPETQALIARVAQVMPAHDFTDHPPPDPRRLGLPAPRITAPNSLTALCSADPEDRVGHARGKAFRDVVRNLQGRLDDVPDLVARPRTERDVIDLLDWCSQDAIAVIPYGGGSSVVGGIEPRFDAPAVTMDLTAMDAVLEIDRASRAARIQAGALGPKLEDQLRPHALTLRHFPQSFGFSTLGGWLPARVVISPRSTPTSTISPSRCGSSPPPASASRDGCRDRVPDPHRTDCSWDRREPSA
jgi:alkyldihydroxyacetonephosphate synthase